MKGWIRCRRCGHLIKSHYYANHIMGCRGKGEKK